MPSANKDKLPEAWMYRGHFLSSKVFHTRFGVLNGTVIELYKGDHMQLEHAFPLTGAKISPVSAMDCDIKPLGVNLFKGYLDGSIKSKQLHIFRVKVSRTHSMLQGKLYLGFVSPTEAQTWRDRVAAATHTHGREPPTDPTGDQEPAWHAEEDLIAASAEVGSEPYFTARLPRELSNTRDPAPPGPQRRACPLPDRAPTNPSSVWQVQFNENGLAGYHEPAQGTYATCCAVAASPLTVFQHLVLLSDGSSSWSFFKHVRVLAAPGNDGSEMVFHAHLSADDSWLSWLQGAGVVARRDVVLQQSWGLRDVDGVFTLCFTSVEHPDAPPVERQGVLDGLSKWREPVRATVHRLAFTIAPLAEHLWESHGRLPEDAPECMVTVLLHSDHAGASPPGSAVKALLTRMHTMWLSPLIQSIVQVRDTVQQKRFVEPLYSMFGGTTEADAAGNERARASALKRSRSALRSRTNLHHGAAAAVSSAVAATSDLAASAGPATVSEAESRTGGAAGVPADAEHEEPRGWLSDKFYYSPDGAEFNVRGPTYLKDKRKQPSAAPAFRLKAMEALITDSNVVHISPYLPVVAQSCAPFLLPIHFTLPYGGKPMHLVVVFEADGDPTSEVGAAGMDLEDEPFLCALAEFVTGASAADTKRRNSTLKMIPMVKEGSWVMRQAVGSTPVIIGNKINTSYHRGEHYLEITVDIGSNSTAASITNYVAGSVSALSIWLGFVLEGKCAEHLPERLLGTVCLDHLDLKAARPLDVSRPLQRRCSAKPADDALVAAAPRSDTAAVAAKASPAPQTGVPTAGLLSEAAAVGMRGLGVATAAGGGSADATVSPASETSGTGGSASESAASAKTTSYEMVDAPLKRPQPAE